MSDCAKPRGARKPSGSGSRRENEKLKDDRGGAAAAYRQAAPFSRGTRTATPQRPSRKAGRAYGRRAHRRVPSRIDETWEVPLPRRCPHCTGAIHREVSRRNTKTSCRCSGRWSAVSTFTSRATRVPAPRAGRHPLQTADVLGAAAVHLGPQAVAFALLLNKGHPRRTLSAHDGRPRSDKSNSYLRRLRREQVFGVGDGARLRDGRTRESARS